MTVTLTAFQRSPDGGRGLARDTRVRWALEEVGEPYEVRLVSFGAIVFHVAERRAGLLPDDANARAHWRSAAGLQAGFRGSIGG